MNYSVHTDSDNVIEVTDNLTQFILENGVVIGIFKCLNKARLALASAPNGPILLLDDNATGDYLLVDLTM